MDTYLKQATVDLIILDLMLPGENGLDIIKRLNSQLAIPG
jgi:DNA-binding response OmpR family regulator